MILLYVSQQGCYPCERANEVLSKYKGLPLKRVLRGSEEAVELGIISTPTLVLLDSDNNIIKRLTGAHKITKIEVDGLIRDFITSQEA